MPDREYHYLRRLSSVLFKPKQEEPVPQHPDFRNSWDECQANLRLLQTCRGHEFVLDLGRYQKSKCIHCGGLVSGIEAVMYERGFQHGVEHATRNIAQADG